MSATRTRAPPRGHAIAAVLSSCGLPGTDYACSPPTTGGQRRDPLPDTFRSCCAPPRWVGSVEAESVDANVDAVSPGAGAAHVPSTDIPGIGRFAMVASPQGGGFALFTPQVRHSARHPAGGTGHVGGHELCSADWQSAPAFYGSLFGWGKGHAADIGPIGTYQLFTTGDVPIAGMFNQPDGHRAPFWLSFDVAGIDAGAAPQGGRRPGPERPPAGAWW